VWLHQTRNNLGDSYFAYWIGSSNLKM
jgi:hypothetical protein